MLEKLALALILTVRRLRQYFLSHPITVLTNSTLGHVLSNPKASGRLIKWAMELSEYDLEYQPRTAIKAQVLVDILVETSKDIDKGVKKIFTDGSATQKGSGVEILFVSPYNDEIKMVVQLCFKASNNEAKYEAVLVGLHAAKYIGATKVILYSDSQLVAQ